ncbi:MAG: putative ABC transporter permease [Dorea sp.]|nr:putative ABC transporter permease [Dorea sp.]
MELYHLAAFFFIYGVLGWCVEVAYAAAKQGEFVNRGFLNGPICPIYGVGVVSVIYCLGEVKGNLAVLYAASVALVTVIEGITGFVMDRLFHHKWWDYTDQPLNIGGYVCLVFSLIWGVFCVFIMKVFQPMVKGVVIHIPFMIGLIVLIVCAIAMSADLYVTASAVLKLNKKLEAMDKIASELHELSDRMGENIYENVKEGMEKEEKLKEKARYAKEAGRELKAEYDAERRIRREELLAKKEELHARYEKLLKEKGVVGERLLQAFPGMESRKYKAALQELKKSMRTVRK